MLDISLSGAAFGFSHGLGGNLALVFGGTLTGDTTGTFVTGPMAQADMSESCMQARAGGTHQLFRYGRRGAYSGADHPCLARALRWSVSERYGEGAKPPSADCPAAGGFGGTIAVAIHAVRPTGDLSFQRSDNQ